MIEELYKRLSHPYGIEKPSKELKEAIKVLDWNINAWQVISTSITLMLIGFALITPIFISLTIKGSYLTATLIILIPISIYIFFTEYPKYIAKTEISKEIGEIPLLISELAILLRQNPNIENAILQLNQFEGKIFKRLKEIEAIKRSIDTLSLELSLLKEKCEKLNKT